MALLQYYVMYWKQKLLNRYNNTDTIVTKCEHVTVMCSFEGRTDTRVIVRQADDDGGAVG